MKSLLFVALVAAVFTCSCNKEEGGAPFPITIQRRERVDSERQIYLRTGKVEGIRPAFYQDYVSFYHDERLGLQDITFLSPTEAVINGSGYYNVRKADSVITLTKNTARNAVARFTSASWYTAYYSYQKTGEPAPYFLYKYPAERSTDSDSAFVGYGDYHALTFPYHSFNLRYSEGNVIVTNSNGTQTYRVALPGDKPGFFRPDAIQYLDANDTLIVINRTLKFN